MQVFLTILYVLLGLIAILILPIVLRIAFYILGWIIVVVVCLFFSPKKKYEKPSNFSYKMLNFSYFLTCSCARIKIHVSGKEILPNGERFLFVSNHRSRFDNMIHSLVMKNEKILFISKEENLKIPVARRFINRNCFVSFERGSAKSAFEMIRKSINFIKSGIASIGVFPEGTRSKTGELLPFKPGVFKIAEKAKCPIVVGVIKETERIHKNWPFKRTDVYFKIVKVFRPEDFSEKNTVDLSDEIYLIINDELKKKWSD